MLTRLPTLPIAPLLAFLGVALAQSQIAPNSGAHPGSWSSIGLQQDVTITGTVTDVDGDPLAGATVRVPETFIGAATDIDGNYELTVPDDATILVFSFVGFVTQEVAIEGRTVIDVMMEEDMAGLEEIIVTGYGTQLRKDVTGSIASVSAADIASRPVASVEKTLQGLMPGINVADRSANPGDLAQISIRAIGSLSAGYEPLWVIDGFPTDQRNAQMLNPADIESIDVLKDASATAIYGSRGANGVIIVTTKSGLIGTAQINLAMNAGVSNITQASRFKMLNAQEYVQFHTEKNGGTTPEWISSVWDGSTNTDWQDELYETAPFHSWSLSAHGGTEKVSYLLSSSYTQESGVIPGEGFNKVGARVKLDYRPNNRITFGLNVAPSVSKITKSSRPSEDGSDWRSAWAQAILLPPIIPIFDSDGEYAIGSYVPGNFPIGNPLQTVNHYKRTHDLFRMLGGVSLAVEAFPGITFKSILSTNIGSDKNESLYDAPPGTPRFSYPSVSTLNVGQVWQRGWLNENTVNFRRQFRQDHFFDVLAGFTLQRDRVEFVSSNVAGLQIPGARILSIGDSETLTSRNGFGENALASVLGRLNYSFKDRYLLTATVRRDGSSRFGANNRYQTFGSFALGWRLSEEDFVKELGFVNDAKLRVSYGSTGSNAIPDFIARPSLRPVNHSLGAVQLTGVAIGDPGNPGLTWETSEQLDIGLDLILFDGRYSVVLDYYNNVTTSLLLSRNIVASSGYGGFLTNIGSMRNDGIELSASVAVMETNDFELVVGGNVTNNNQEILDLGGDEEIRNFFGALRRTVGGELQNIHVVEHVGIVREGETHPAQPGAAPGTMVYRDADGDGSISNFLGPDGVNLEGTNLDYIYGFHTDVRYKDFELSVRFNGQAGASVLDLYIIQIGAPFRRVNLSREFWYDGRYISESEPGDGKTPSASGFDTGIGAVSSLGIQDTDFLRLRNITLTYNLPQRLLQGIGVRGARGRIYTSMENVHMWTSFIGGNPEGRRNSAGGPSLFGGSRIPGVADGREIGLTSPPHLPLPRIWTFGIHLTY
ncbi:MAG: TonB-dependent receptor [Rhodothermaceae bacterium]|nr:TonB-dependent receptor [Rhodothermaceae bacterium]MYD18660.1 TonB-dependent receptor [Rhodothermaceae bacterium]MYD57936.1 TonB-dependent receptor [Rhodothermaceae bacterium]MYI44584.1 TonB-dependent receptor [Rhodothermaceae bacterium]